MKKLFLLFNIIFFGFGLSAQTINLEQVRTLALLNSRTLARSNLAVTSSLLNERNQLFSRLPQVSARYEASMSYLNNDWEFVNPIDTFNSSLSLSLSFRIFDGGREYIQRDINSIATESVRREALAAYFSVLDSADSAYYAVLEAAAALEAEESSLQTAVFSLSIAEIRQASGMINQGEYLRALAEKESRENSRNQARRSLALNITRLESLIGTSGLPLLEQIDFSKYEELILHLGNISDEEAILLFERLWAVISAENPTLARSALSIQTAEKNLSMIRRDSLPVINASIITPSIGYSTANGFRHSSGGGGISITGTIPIDFWVTNNRIERSQIALDLASQDYINAESSLEIELYSTLINIFGNAGSVLSSRRTLDYAERNFEFVMERYRLLQSSISELQEASTMLINNRNSHIRALYGFLQNLSRLRSLSVIDDEERIINLLTGN